MGRMRGGARDGFVLCAAVDHEPKAFEVVRRAKVLRDVANSSARPKIISAVITMEDEPGTPVILRGRAADEAPPPSFVRRSSGSRLQPPSLGSRLPPPSFVRQSTCSRPRRRANRRPPLALFWVHEQARAVKRTRSTRANRARLVFDGGRRRGIRAFGRRSVPTCRRCCLQPASAVHKCCGENGRTVCLPAGSSGPRQRTPRVSLASATAAAAVATAQRSMHGALGTCHMRQHHHAPKEREVVCLLCMQSRAVDAS
jgi:hypothetical protein